MSFSLRLLCLSAAVLAASVQGLDLNPLSPNVTFVPAPSNDGLSSILLTLIPGMQAPADNYVPVLQQIQSKAAAAGINVNLAIMAMPFNLVNPYSVQLGVNQVLDYATNQLNLDPSKIFAYAHSAGGPMSGDIIKKSGFGGAIYVGSYLMGTAGEALSDYGVPILHMTGELDGLTPLSRTSYEYNVFAQRFNNNTEDAIRNVPVLMIPGASHSDTCGGCTNTVIATEDTGSVIRETTRAQVEDYLSTNAVRFLQLQVPANNVQDAIQGLTDETQTASPFFYPHIFAREYDMQGTVCSQSQIGVDNFSAQANSYVNIQNQFFSSLSTLQNYHIDKSKAAISGSTFNLVTGSTLEYITPDGPIGFAFSAADLIAALAKAVLTGNLDRLYKDVVANLDAALKHTVAIGTPCKNLRQAAVINVLATSLNISLTSSDYGTEASCRNINEMVLETVLVRLGLPDRTVQRYLTAGKQISFSNDQSTGSGISWVNTPVQININNTNIDISSPTLVTPVRLFGGLFDSLAGAHYCKLVSLAEIVDTVMTTAFRP